MAMRRRRVVLVHGHLEPDSEQQRPSVLEPGASLPGANKVATNGENRVVTLRSNLWKKA